MTIRFSPHNAFGVMDHWVKLGESREIYVTLRVVANGDEVMLTRNVGDKFAEDAVWSRRDLEA